MLSQNVVCMAVIAGFYPKSFIIDDIYDDLETTKDIIRIIAPKKKGSYRFKTYKNYNPNEKRKYTNKGRPNSTIKKEKYIDTMRTCIEFYVRTYNPDKDKYHKLIIKYFKTGSINITGITNIRSIEEGFGEIELKTFNRFETYINKFFKEDNKLLIHNDRFNNLNFKSYLLNNRVFNKKRIYDFIKETFESYERTNKDNLEKFIFTFLTDNEKDFDILSGKTNIILDIRYDKNILSEQLSHYNISRIKEIVNSCSIYIRPFIIENIKKHISNEIYNFLYKQPINIIGSCNSDSRSKGGVGLRLNINGEEKKINIYNKSYNSYCKSLAEGDIIHNIINDMIINNKEIFLCDYSSVNFSLESWI